MYQAVASTELSRGYRLEKVQGYAESQKYLAVFYQAGQAECP